MASAPSIGIDLGTTFSCVSVFQNGRAEVIANSLGNRITPSVVAFTQEGDRLIGESAATQRRLDPPNVIFNAKRFIGRSTEDLAVKEYVSNYPFKIEKHSNKFRFKVQCGKETLAIHL